MSSKYDPPRIKVNGMTLTPGKGQKTCNSCQNLITAGKHPLGGVCFGTPDETMQCQGWAMMIIFDPDENKPEEK